MNKNKQEIVEVPKEEVFRRLGDGEQVWAMTLIQNYIFNNRTKGTYLDTVPLWNGINITDLRRLLQDESNRYFLVVEEGPQDESD